MANSQDRVSMTMSNHHKNIGNTLEKLRDGSEFTDVTLVSEDGQQGDPGFTKLIFHESHGKEQTLPSTDFYERHEV